MSLDTVNINAQSIYHLFNGITSQKCNTQDENVAAAVRRFCIYPRGILNFSDTLQMLVSLSKV